MEDNVGTVDAGIRWLLAAAFFAVSLVFNQSPAVALVAAVAAVVMVATALTHSCPIYRIFGLSTCPRGPTATKGARRLT